MNNKITVGLIGIAIIVVAVYLIYASQPIVSAQGYASLKAQPDEVSVYLNIQATDNTAQGAKDKYDIINNKVLDVLNSLGYDKSKIELLSFSLNPEYDYSNGSRSLIGYVASSQIIVKVSDFNKVAEIVDKSVNAGALITSINFELSPQLQNQYKIQALEAASADSKTKAGAIAEGLGKKLGSLASVNSQEFNYPGPLMVYSSAMGGNAGGEKAADNLSPQDIEVSATVTAEYRLRIF